MRDIVFLTAGEKEPFTTSEVIAECAEVHHDTVQKLITRHEADFRQFGIIGFEIRKIEGRGRPEHIYHLNEQQATLLMTYLRNSDVVRAFKIELVRQFYAMRKELQKREAFRLMDKEHQKNEMKRLQDSMSKADKVDYVKANTIADKAISNRYGYAKMLKKAEMTPEMLAEREPIVQDVVNLMIANESFDLNLSISKRVYDKYSN